MGNSTKKEKKKIGNTVISCSTGELVISMISEHKIYIEGTETCKQMVYQLPIFHAGLTFNPKCYTEFCCQRHFLSLYAEIYF